MIFSLLSISVMHYRDEARNVIMTCNADNQRLSGAFFAPGTTNGYDLPLLLFLMAHVVVC
jgi:hypothetical protein